MKLRRYEVVVNRDLEETYHVWADNEDDAKEYFHYGTLKKEEVFESVVWSVKQIPAEDALPITKEKEKWGKVK